MQRSSNMCFNFFDLYILSQPHPKFDKRLTHFFGINFRFPSQPHLKCDKRLTHFPGIDFAGPQIPGFYVYCASFICMLPIKLVSLCLCILNYHNLYEAGWECLFFDPLCYILGDCKNTARLRHNTKYLFTMIYNNELTQTQAIPYFSKPVSM